MQIFSSTGDVLWGIRVINTTPIIYYNFAISKVQELFQVSAAARRIFFEFQKVCVFNGFGAFLLAYIQQEVVLRSAVFAKYPGLPISKSYDQNKFSCFPLMKTARINEKRGLYKGDNLACSHVQIQDPPKKSRSVCIEPIF